jgi:succinate-semialdehyde dehydrogenase/glutarate-semialdehyde dehydrogenase
MRQADKVQEVSRSAETVTDIQHVDDAVSKGAKVLVGGKRGNRTEFIPTVLTNVSNDCVSYLKLDF